MPCQGRQAAEQSEGTIPIGGAVMNITNIFVALEIMWKGMAGLFAAVLIIMLCVYIMGKIGKK